MTLTYLTYPLPLHIHTAKGLVIGSQHIFGNISETVRPMRKILMTKMIDNKFPTSFVMYIFFLKFWNHSVLNLVDLQTWFKKMKFDSCQN